MCSKSSQTYVLHDPNSLFRLSHKLIFCGLNLCPSLLTQRTLVIRVHAACHNGVLLRCFRAIQHESTVLNRLSSFCCKHQVCVEGCIPSRQEPGLDLVVLCKTSFANFFLSKSVLLKSGRERIFANPQRVCLGEELGASQGCTCDGMIEGLRLRFGRRRSSECGSGFTR
jgi:hypothetical protein